MEIERVWKASKKCDFISNVLMHIIAHFLMLCKQKEANLFFLWWLANINIIVGLFARSMLTHNAHFLAILLMESYVDRVLLVTGVESWLTIVKHLAFSVISIFCPLIFKKQKKTTKRRSKFQSSNQIWSLEHHKTRYNRCNSEECWRKCTKKSQLRW